jgi:hypothetical protein
MSDVRNALLGIAEEDTQDSDNESAEVEGNETVKNLPPKKKPFTSAEPQDGRKARAWRSEESDHQSNKHEYYRPAKEHMPPGIGAGHKDDLLHKLRSAEDAEVGHLYGDGLSELLDDAANTDSDKWERAPFQVRVQLPSGRVVLSRYWNAGPAVKRALAFVTLTLNARKENREVDVRVQKRVGSDNKWHNSPEQSPRLCARLDVTDSDGFGLFPFVERFDANVSGTLLDLGREALRTMLTNS